MKLKLSIFWGLLVIPGFALPNPVFDTLDGQGISRLDLAMVRLNQEAFEYEIKEKMSGSRAFDFGNAGVRFDNETKRIEFFATAAAEPTEFYCRLGLRNFMKHFHFGGDSDNAAKIFYYFYFMPVASPPLSYEIQLYESVYRNTSFEMTIVDDESTPKLQCMYSGSSKEISYSLL